MNTEKHADIYESGNVIQFRPDKRVTDSMAIGIAGTGTYSSIPRKRKTTVSPLPKNPTTGGDAA